MAVHHHECRTFVSVAIRIHRDGDKQRVDQEMFQDEADDERARHTTVRIRPRHYVPDRVHVTHLTAAFSCIDLRYAAET